MYLKCCQGLENGKVALQCYVVTKFYQLLTARDLKVH